MNISAFIIFNLIIIICYIIYLSLIKLYERDRTIFCLATDKKYHNQHFKTQAIIMFFIMPFSIIGMTVYFIFWLHTRYQLAQLGDYELLIEKDRIANEEQNKTEITENEHIKTQHNVDWHEHRTTEQHKKEEEEAIRIYNELPITFDSNLMQTLDKQSAGIYLNKILGREAIDKLKIFERNADKLFPLFFEWQQTDKYKSILKAKSIKYKGGTFSLTFIEPNRHDSNFVYNDLCHAYTFRLPEYGIINIKYPVNVALIRNMYEGHNGEYIAVNEDRTIILEIDYSPESISLVKQIIEYRKKKKEEYEKKEKELRQKQKEEAEKESIKKAIKTRIQKEELKKQAMQELEDEGILFPEAGKRPPIPKSIVDAIWRRDKGCCVYCGSTENLQIDHIIPFSKGGSSNIENLQLLCQKCNLKKSNHIG